MSAELERKPRLERRSANKSRTARSVASKNRCNQHERPDGSGPVASIRLLCCWPVLTATMATMDGAVADQLEWQANR